MIKKILGSGVVMLFITATALAQGNYGNNIQYKDQKGMVHTVNVNTLPSQNAVKTTFPSNTGHPAATTSASDKVAPTGEDNDRVKAANRADAEREKQYRKEDRAREDRNEKLRNSSFYATNGIATEIEFMYNRKMEAYLKNEDYLTAIQCHDSLLSYLKSINMADDGFYDLYNNNTSAAYFGIGYYEPGMYFYTNSYWYKYLRNSDGAHQVFDTYWTGFEHLAYRRDYLDSIKLVADLWLTHQKYLRMEYVVIRDLNHARCDIMQGNYKQADSLLSQNIRLYEKHDKSFDNIGPFGYFGYYYYRALSAYKQGRLKDAEKDCKKSSKIPENCYKLNEELMALLKK